MIEHLCRKAQDARNPMTPSQYTDCKKTASGGTRYQGIKVVCNQDNADYTNQLRAIRKGWIFLSVTEGGHFNWGSDEGKGRDGTTGVDLVSVCLIKIVRHCKDKAFSCILNEIDNCGKVCPDFKARLKDARANSLIEAQGENELKDRATLLVDAHGRTARNASASIMSLDDSVSGKCSQ